MFLYSVIPEIINSRSHICTYFIFSENRLHNQKYEFEYFAKLVEKKSLSLFINYAVDPFQLYSAMTNSANFCLFLKYFNLLKQCIILFTVVKAEKTAKKK